MTTSKSTPKLSLVIVNYNSGHYLANCLQSLYRSTLVSPIEIIVVDNKSTDKSISLAKKIKNKKPQIFNFKFLSLNSNPGFSKGNNQGVKKTNPNSPYLLFLNPDTIVEPDTIQKTIDFLDKHPQASALTCKIILKINGKMQPECHRGFPTPWRAFCYFSGLGKLFPKSAFFNGYFLGHLDTTKIHPIEACVGAFLAVRRSAGNQIGWWNEKYFFYGEDLDFCWKLHQNNLKLYFNPHLHITHYQGISSGLRSKIATANRATKIKAALASTQAMRIFYQQNLLKNYSPLVRILVMQAINFLEFTRMFRAKYL